MDAPYIVQRIGSETGQQRNGSSKPKEGNFVYYEEVAYQQKQDKFPKSENKTSGESSEQRDRLALNFLTFQATSSPLALLDVNIAGLNVRACADTCASKTVAGELLYFCLLKQGVNFRSTSITKTLANGYQTKEAACTTLVTFKIEKKVLTLDLLALPKAKGNRTLLGTDFLGKAGIVPILKHKNYHFDEDQTRKIPFRENIPVCLLRSVETVPYPEFPLPVDPVRDETEPDACQKPDVSPNDLSTTQISEVVQLQNCHLREEERRIDQAPTFSFEPIVDGIPGYL
ncbi:hypothetical protein HNY73_011299 [Argiope bruennichi]|uniref:Uncharacterized protein n=1 Tax=Argiope bruennichi TaxID=94029 RepID=A0A8T0F3N7_ARGBR|nr:hypothetical protein HNY73_011299 [Argiope bruennichi]